MCVPCWIEAKRIALIGCTLAVSTLVLLALVVASIPHQLGKIFSSDPDVIHLFVEIRIPLALVMVAVSLISIIRDSQFLEGVHEPGRVSGAHPPRYG